ncbi:MAG TPA: DUF6326 family protein, partial [Anaerolineales bacterium]
RVFGSTGIGSGAHAEFLCLPEEPNEMEGAMALMPSSMSFDEAATIPFGARDALHFVRNAGIEPGDRMLINDAGGSIGVLAVQLAKDHGAEATAVDTAAKLAMLRSIGADHVIDYQREDFSQAGEAYDILFDVVGSVSTGRARRALRPDGIFLSANPTLRQMAGGQWTRLTTDRRVFLRPAAGSTADLAFLRNLTESGQLHTVIDRSYPLDRIVEAHHYVETGAKAGNLVIRMPVNEGAYAMVDTRIILAGLWTALMLTYLLGDVLRIFSGDFVAGEIGGMKIRQWMYLGMAVLMLIPIVMVVLSLTLGQPVLRWVTIAAAAFLFLFNLVGLPTYPSAYDKFLIVVGLVFNAVTLWYAWNWR